ncbi:TIGR03085 family protein [Zafaria cholistanensis]|uniref:TIGR03085 family protein n=1 Tax=Zafaria cholistanensis TaxID=1682741 RepID=A0A5A7NRX3_9MICC|nr:TIGR03085 family metal-binding protein [Zafaria cholistanensis]GER23479.1 TIGR03085 family protein [Zafaria cholistanensis]
MRFVHPSREVLAEVLLAAGPDQPTLCAGWRTRHLAAHLVLREHGLLAAGIVARPLAARFGRAVAALAAQSAGTASYAALVARFRAGPPRFSPLALPALGEAANLVEFFVHTEDVRRASERWAPRVLDDEYSEALWHALVRASGLLYRRSPVGVILVRPDGVRHVAKRAASAVAVVGDPAELLMHAFGRRGHALVTFEGTAQAVERLAGDAPAGAAGPRHRKG